LGGFFIYLNMKKHNYVDCRRCDHWDPEDRLKQICKGCNNSGKIIDPKELLCNLCGECVCPLGTMNEQYPHGLFNAKVQGGYDSYHLFDMNTYTFSFCEKCLRNLFNQCKIPPDLFDSISSSSDDYAQDRKQYEFRVWKDEGGCHRAYLNGKCNFVKDCPNKAVYTQLHNGDFTEACSCEEHKELWGYSNSELVKFIPNVLKPFL
jgi:hypothetical protein